MMSTLTICDQFVIPCLIRCHRQYSNPSKRRIETDVMKLYAYSPTHSGLPCGEFNADTWIMLPQAYVRL